MVFAASATGGFFRSGEPQGAPGATPCGRRDPARHPGPIGYSYFLIQRYMVYIYIYMVYTI